MAGYVFARDDWYQVFLLQCVRYIGNSRAGGRAGGSCTGLLYMAIRWALFGAVLGADEPRAISFCARVATAWHCPSAVRRHSLRDRMARRLRLSERSTPDLPNARR